MLELFHFKQQYSLELLLPSFQSRERNEHKLQSRLIRGKSKYCIDRNAAKLKKRFKSKVFHQPAAVFDFAALGVPHCRNNRF